MLCMEQVAMIFVYINHPFTILKIKRYLSENVRRLYIITYKNIFCFLWTFQHENTFEFPLQFILFYYIKSAYFSVWI